MRLLHTCLRVGNLEASLKFYNEVMGLVITREKDFPEHKFKLVYLSDVANGYEIELTHNYDTDKYEIGNGFSHIALEAIDLEAEHERIEGLGYQVGALRGLPGNKPNYFFVTDPDGYQVEIIRKK